MRGLFIGLLVVLLASPVFAQATGEVKAIGFNGTFRSTGWTPMVVSLHPTTDTPGSYEIRIIQHDLDGDRPVYVKPISLSGASSAKDQNFWMYFQTEPIHSGLGFNITPGNVKDLQKDLTVFLTTPNGKQVVAKLPLTLTVTDIDPVKDTGKGIGTKGRGTRLVLVVTNGGKQLPIGDYANAVGVNEDIEPITVRPTELPDNPLGYEAVDAIVWLDGDPTTLSGTGSLQLAAMQDYVRYGGRLVVCQSTTNWQEDTHFGDMLPVDVTGVGNKTNLEPLFSMATPPQERDLFQTVTESWGSVPGPFVMARATPRTGAVVDNWIDWKEDHSNLEVSPYLARKGWGLGQVTWVAQPLSADVVPNNPAGWPYIWNHIFGWANDAYVLPPKENPDSSYFKSTGKQNGRLDRYQPSNAVDLGSPLIAGLNLGSKGAWLIFLAVVFFLVYWVVAGPGSYVVLAIRKKRGLSWFVFGGSALVATAITIGVVKLVLRGPPEVRHVSFVRVTAGQPTIVWSRFGLYIPRDGDQTLSLSGTSPSSVSYISPFAEHPQYLTDVNEFAVPLDYEVPVREMKSDTDPVLTVPYRSSLKKFQVRWVGEMSTGVGGLVKLDLKDARLPLSGSLTNSTGVELDDVYLIFNKQDRHDWVIYIPKWATGVTLDIKRDLAKPARMRDVNSSSKLDFEAVPGEQKNISDELAPDITFRSKSGGLVGGWADYWYNEFRAKGHSSSSDTRMDEEHSNFYYPALSIFSRLPPMPNQLEDKSSRFRNPNAAPVYEMGHTRLELINRGARQLDAGDAVGAGQLLVLGSAAGPLPIELKVNGTKVAGEGTTFYQFILPLDRGPLVIADHRPVAGAGDRAGGDKISFSGGLSFSLFRNSGRGPG